MRVRIFAGESWNTATEQGDYEFELLPAIGHKLAIQLPDAWAVAIVRDIAHRIVDRDEAPDIAILMGMPRSGGSVSDPLPLALLDERCMPQAAASVPRAKSPWGTGN